MSELSHIDEHFRQQQGDWEGKPSESSWNDLSDKLDGFNASRKGTRHLIVRSAVAACVAAMLVISVLMFNFSFEPTGFQAEQSDSSLYDHESLPVATTSALPDSGRNSVQSNPASGGLMTSADRESNAPVIASSQNKAKKIPYDVVLNTMEESIETMTDVELEIASSNIDAADEHFNDISEYVPEILEDDEPDMDNIADQDGESTSAYRPGGDGFTTGGREIEEAVDATTSFNAEAGDFEYPSLTNAVVANAEGIEVSKAEHKQSASKRTKIAPAKSGETAMYEMDRSDEFVLRSLVVLIPSASNANCKYMAFLVEEDVFYIDRCQSDHFDVKTTESMPLENSPVLKLLYNSDLEQLKSMTGNTMTAPCTDLSDGLKLVYRYSTQLSYYEENIPWPSSLNCLSEEGQTIILQLIDLAGRYKN